MYEIIKKINNDRLNDIIDIFKQNNAISRSLLSGKLYVGFNYADKAIQIGIALGILQKEHDETVYGHKVIKSVDEIEQIFTQLSNFSDETMDPINETILNNAIDFIKSNKSFTLNEFKEGLNLKSVNEAMTYIDKLQVMNLLSRINPENEFTYSRK